MSASTLGAGVLLGDFEAGSPEWWDARRDRLGGSEIAAVLGLSRWQSPFSLWHLKMDHIPPQIDREWMEWGRDLEELIARRFARRHTEWQVSDCGLYANQDRPWQCAEPDRVVTLPGGQLAALECKTDRYADGWGSEGTSEIPVYYRAQAMWQCDTFGWDICYVAVLITGCDYREYVIQRDDDEIALMRSEGHRFVRSLVDGTPPSIDEHDATYRTVRELHPDIDGTEIEVPHRVGAEYLAALVAYAEAEGEKSRAEAELLAAMGTARRALHDGQRIAIRVPTQGAPPHLRPSKQKRKAA